MKKKKSFFDMTPAERDRDVAKFDGPLDWSKTRPLTRGERVMEAIASGNIERFVREEREIAAKAAKPTKSQAANGKSHRRPRPAAANVSLIMRQGKTDVPVPLDRALIKQLASYAKKHKTSLPKMIDRGLRGLIAFSA